jgi:hypothetical protein
VDADDPRGVTRPAADPRPGAATGSRLGPSKAPRQRRTPDPGLAIGVATMILGFLLLAGPARAADPLLPSLPVPLPTLPLPTPPPLPVPTLPPLPTPTLPPLPTLPLQTLPLPTLPPVPTPTLTLPTPSLPLPTATLGPTSPPTAAPSVTASPSAGASVVGVGPLGPGPSFGGPIDAQPVAATGVPSEPLPPFISGLGSLFDTLGLPGLVVGIPAVIILGILGVQLAVGAAWMPVIRRWLNRRA